MRAFIGATDMKKDRTIADYRRPAYHDFPKETIVNGKRMMVFARCTCGAIIPMDYTDCADCNPDRQIVSIGHEGRDDLRLKGVKQ